MIAIKQIFLNTITGWIAVIIRTPIALVMVPFLLSRLGKEGYGLIGLLGVIISMASVADLGLRSALGRELAEQVARKDSRAFSELASTAFMLYLLIASILAMIGWILAAWFVDVFKVAEAYKTDAIWLIRIYGSFSLFISFMTPVYSAALSAYHRFDVVNIINATGGILSSLMLIIVISKVDNPLWGWVAVMLVFHVALFLIHIFCFKRFCGGAQLGFCYLNVSRLFSLFHLGGYMYALQMTNALSERSDPLVISYFYGPSGVALYQPGGRFSQIIRSVVMMMAEQMHPVTTMHHVKNEVEKMQKILIYGTKYTLMLGTLFTVAVLILAEPFCRLWLLKSLGQDYQIVAKVMMGWALVDFMIYAGGTQWSVLLGMKKLRFLIYTQLPTGVLNIVLSIYLVGFTNYGIPGVLVATILIGFIRRPILLVYTAELCKIKSIDYFKASYLTPIICLIITLFGSAFARKFIAPDSYLKLILCVALTASIWAAGCWVIGLESTERWQVLSVFKKVLLNKKAV